MAGMQRTVLGIKLECYKCKREALQCITQVAGIDMIQVNTKEHTIIVEGEADPACVANHLKKKFKCTRILNSGPVPPPPPPPEPKKAQEPKPPEPEKKKEEPKPAEPEKQKEEAKPAEPEKQKEKPKPAEPEKQKENPKPPEPEKQKEKPKPPPEKQKENPKPPANPPLTPCGPSHPPCMGYDPCRPYDWCRPVHYCGCSACSRRSDILWPTFHPPRAPPDEIWYVWDEESQNSCTIC